jgi:hypothetical protein
MGKIELVRGAVHRIDLYRSNDIETCLFET